MKRRLLLLAGTLLLLSGSPLTASADTLSDDEATVATQIKRLSDSSNIERADAAAILRRIVARHPSGTTNLREADAGRARWQKTLSQIKPGMTKADVLKLLPSASEQLLIGTGQGHTVTYRLDDHWETGIAYKNGVASANKETTVTAVYDLKKLERAVAVQPPPDFTGTWTGWYLNGQKAFEIEYAQGKLNGTHTHFHDNGQKSYEQHYTNNIADGADTGWYPSGKRMYTGQYRNDQQVGTWTHWYESGRKQVENTYRNGKSDGVSISWYENGHKQYETHYRQGIQDGRVAAWNAQGTLEYKHEYKNGTIVGE